MTIPFCVILASCATIISGSKPKRIAFVCGLPYPQEIRILDTSGNVEQRHIVRDDTTWITIKAKKRFFKRKAYKVWYLRSGFPTDEKSLVPKINRWFWGNLPLGGIWVVIDGATGAMYQLPKVVKH